VGDADKIAPYLGGESGNAIISHTLLDGPHASVSCHHHAASSDPGESSDNGEGRSIGCQEERYSLCEVALCSVAAFNGSDRLRLHREFEGMPP
jgi:hypothetical protein